MEIHKIKLTQVFNKVQDIKMIIRINYCFKKIYNKEIINKKRNKSINKIKKNKMNNRIMMNCKIKLQKMKITINVFFIIFDIKKIKIIMIIKNSLNIKEEFNKIDYMKFMKIVKKHL